VPEGDGTGRLEAGEKRALTVGELRRLLAELSPQWQLMFEFLAHTGLRIGEAIELRWERDLLLDREHPYLRLRWQYADGRVCAPKTRYGRRDIPLSPGLTAKLRLARPASGEGLVFSSSFGTRLNRHNLCRVCSGRPRGPQGLSG
jgi:integrase